MDNVPFRHKATVEFAQHYVVIVLITFIVEGKYLEDMFHLLSYGIYISDIWTIPSSFDNFEAIHIW